MDIAIQTAKSTMLRNRVLRIPSSLYHPGTNNATDAMCDKAQGGFGLRTRGR